MLKFSLSASHVTWQWGVYQMKIYLNRIHHRPCRRRLGSPLKNCSSRIFSPLATEDLSSNRIYRSVNSFANNSKIRIGLHFNFLFHPSPTLSLTLREIFSEFHQIGAVKRSLFNIWLGWSAYMCVFQLVGVVAWKMWKRKSIDFYSTSLILSSPFAFCVSLVPRFSPPPPTPPTHSSPLPPSQSRKRSKNSRMEFSIAEESNMRPSVCA